jgi:hypothetical protein
MYSCLFVISILALLFIFFFVSWRCGHILMEGDGTTGCVIGIGTFWFEAVFLVGALYSLYRVNMLMKSG